MSPRSQSGMKFKHQDFRRRLLRWFSRQRKSYPWRDNPTPYTVWISEIMLQQTVTTAVVPYFQRWLAQFPDVRALAAATETQVLRAWEGLGYYSRARNAHRAAQAIVAQQGGKIPDDYDALLRLPGVGAYTAAAIASIAFGRPYAVIDANVRRVVGRLLKFGKPDDRDDEYLRKFLNAAISVRRPGAFNEALMELGQTLCRPRNPLCEQCPLKSMCRAFACGIDPGQGRARALAKILKESLVLIVYAGGELLLEKSTGGRFRQMWSFPRLPATADENAAIAAWAKGNLGRPAKIVHRLSARDHFYTRYRDRLRPLVLKISNGAVSPGDLEWYSLSRIEDLPLPSIDRKILKELRGVVGMIGKGERLRHKRTSKR